MSNASFRFGVVILAAGAARRMGSPKLLLSWGGTTILGHIVNQWRSLGARQIAPVIRPNDENLQAELRRLELDSDEWITNARAATGMFSSMQAAAAWTGWKPEITHCVIVLGDQPQIGGETLGNLLKFAEASPHLICQPRFDGRAKHPVILPKGLFEEIRSSARVTLREFLNSRKMERGYVDLNDEALAVDLDLPEEYRAALERFKKSENP